MTRRTIEKFYKGVAVAAAEGGKTVLLDGKPVKTPGRTVLLLPTRALADAIADEWRAQGAQVVPHTMPLTGLACAALDMVPGHRGQVIDHALGFGRSDLLCYRAAVPEALAERQAQMWDPLLAWIAQAHGVRLQSDEGVAYIEQPAGAILALEKLVAALSDFELVAVDRAASLTGSLVLALALKDGRLDAGAAFRSAQVDEDFQAATWGRDALAEARRANMLDELGAAARLLELLAAAEA